MTITVQIIERLFYFRGNIVDFSWEYLYNDFSTFNGGNIMIKRIVLKQDDLYSTAGIVFYIFELLKYDTNEFNNVNDILTDKKCVSKFFKEKNIEPAKVIDRSFFYTEEALQLIINDKNIMEHFKSRKNSLIKYKNLEAYKKRNERVKKVRASAYTNVDYNEVGLTQKDVSLIEADKFSGGDLLSVNELKFLNKKGFIHKSDLSIKEKRDLELYNNTLCQIEAEDKEIEKLFREKKLEIMITKMFERVCPDLDINESLLKDDIDLLVRGGLYDTETDEFMERNTSDLDIKKENIEKSRMRLDNNFADNYIIVK